LDIDGCAVLQPFTDEACDAPTDDAGCDNVCVGDGVDWGVRLGSSNISENGGVGEKIDEAGAEPSDT